MAITLPALPKAASVGPRLIEAGGVIESPLGGSALVLSRIGDKLAIDVQLPRFEKDQASATLWLSQRMRAKAEGQMVRLVVPQMGDGAGVAACTASSGSGAQLVKSGGAGVAVGMFFSFVKSGRAYLHQVTSIDGSTLGVAPPLRADPTGLTLDFATPTIEGYLDGLAWTLERLRFVGQAFSITEDK